MSAFNFITGEWLFINDQTSTNVIIDDSGNVTDEQNMPVGYIEIVSPTKISLTVNGETNQLIKVAGAWTNAAAKLRLQRR